MAKIEVPDIPAVPIDGRVHLYELHSKKFYSIKGQIHLSEDGDKCGFSFDGKVPAGTYVTRSLIELSDGTIISGPHRKIVVEADEDYEREF